MAKQPIPGSSKTRLTPLLTPEEAAELSRCFVLDTVDLATGFAADHPLLDVAVAGAPAEAGPWFADQAPGVGFVAQRGPSLGDRLDNALSGALAAGYRQALAMNSDSPTLPPAVLDQALAGLGRSDVDVVLGPAADGGYYLIGWKRPHPRMVTDVEMSTSTVLTDTLAIAAEEGLRVELLDRWYDVDQPDDLRSVRADLDAGRRCGHRTAAFFDRRLELGTTAPETAQT